MLGGELGLGIVLEASGNISGFLGQAEASFNRLDGVSEIVAAKVTRNAGLAAKGLAIMGAGVATLFATTKLAERAGQFEEALAGVRAVSGATAADMSVLEKAALSAADKGFAPVEGANALRELAAQGYSAKESIDLLQPSLNLAAGSLGELGIADSAQLAAQTMKAFSIDTKDAKLAVDQLLASANLFALAPKELPLAVGIGARGAQLMHQRLDETLIALGLVKNVIPTVERASTAVAVAMERLAAPHKMQLKFLEEVGLKATDAKGNFRPFLDVLDELTKKLAGKSEGEKARLLNGIFGAEGGAGAQAILTQLQNGVKTASGEILKGADAIKYLRGQMAAAGGTADQFAAILLETLPGQMKLLGAQVDVVLIELGKPFARAFKPIVSGILDGLKKVVGFFQALPDGVKDGIAKAVLAFGTLLTVVGGLVAAKGAIAMVAAAMSFLGVSLGSILIALAPVLVAVGALGLLFAALKVNSEHGGGALEWFATMATKAKLAYQGLVQLFSTGKLSGAVLDDMEKAGNEGVMGFAIQFYVIVNRIKHFWDELVFGFQEKVRLLQPVFDRLLEVVGFVSDYFGIAQQSVGANASAWEKAGAIGRQFGEILANVAGVVANAFTVGMLIAVGAVEALKEIWEFVSPFVTAGANIIVGAVKAVAGVLTGDWSMAWNGVLELTGGIIKAIVHMVLAIPRAVNGAVDAIAGLAGIDLGLKDKLKAIEDQMFQGVDATFGIGAAPGPTLVRNPEALMSVAPTVAAQPGVVAAQQSGAMMSRMDEVMSRAAPASSGGAKPQDINIFNQFSVDGDPIYEGHQRRRRDDAARSFSTAAPWATQE